jgi:acetylornithine deacetylase
MAGRLSAVPAPLDTTEILRRLVGFDSVSRNSNLPIADFISDAVDRPGIRVQRQRSPDGTKANLIVEAGPPVDPATRDGLVLSGHMDVVPAEEPEWRSNPFQLVEQDGRFIGRGSTDMKGFLALAMHRLRVTDPAKLAKPLVLLFTYDEELGCIGAHHFAEHWPKPETLPRNVVIGEPTSMRAVRTHKGHLKLKLIVLGTTAHSGYPHLGHNAIEPMARAIASLSALREQLMKERVESSASFPEVPFVALNIGMINGGVAVNVVPDRCEVDIGMRVLPGMTTDALVTRVREAVTSALQGERWSLEMSGDSPPFMLGADRPVFRDLARMLEQKDEASIAFATDAGWLQTAGFDCVVCGPGDIAVAHKPNESLSVAEFHAADRFLASLVHRATGASA